MNHSHSDPPIGEHPFGRSCAALRQQMQLTQRDLARLLAVSEQDIERWERGLHVPTPEQLKQLTGLALQRHAFPAERAHEELEQLWLGAGQRAGFETFWRLAQQTAAFAPPVLLVLKQEAVQPSESRPSQEPASTPSRVDWGEALHVHALYGREQELGVLTHWVEQEQCRVVSVLGMGGIGKSALAVTLMRQIAPAFQAVVFRSVRDAPACQDLLADCLRVLSPQPLPSLPFNVDQRIDVLLECLQAQRCLLVLDNLETLLQEQDAAGNMRPGSEDYATLLRRVAQTPHQSCLLLTSREAPAALEHLEDSHAGVRALCLGGLASDACGQLFEERELIGTAQERESLVQRYVGNPLALNIVAETISELFGGEIGSFLEQDVVILSSLRDLLAEQWTRLSALEQALLTWLAIVREPVGGVELHKLLVVPVAAVAEEQVRAALDSLQRRSLVEQGKQPTTFTLQSVVLEYVTEGLVKRISQQIQRGVWKDLISYALSQAEAKEYVRQAQERMLVAPILVRLQAVPQQRDMLEERLQRLLDQLRTWDQQAQGYGPANLIALLLLRRGHLRGLDLSQLSIRGACLQGVEMQDAKLCGATLHGTTLTATMPAIWSVAISRTGTFWAAGSLQGEVWVWRAGGQCLHLVWQAHTNATVSLAFSPDERTLATGSWDGAIKLWDLYSGALLWTGWHPSHIFSVVFSPNGQTLASGGVDATVRFWEASSGKQRQTLASSGDVVMLAWSPDGQRLAAGCSDGSLRLWHVGPDGPGTVRGGRSLVGHHHWVYGLAFAPDGTRLASGSWDGTVKLWDVASGSELQTLTGHTQPVYNVAWSPDGGMVASASADQRIWLWDVAQNRYQTVLQGHSATVYGLAFTPDSRCLLSGSEDRTIRVWEVSSGQCVRILQGYALRVYDLDWNPNSTHLVSGNSDGRVLLWEVTGEGTGKTPLRVLEAHQWIVYGVAWSPDGSLLASSGWDNAIRIWNTMGGTCLHLLRDPDPAGTLFYGVAWSPDGRLLACGSYKGIYVWEVKTRRLQVVEGTKLMMLRHLAWSSDGTRLASGSPEGKVCLWDITTGMVQQLQPRHQREVTSVAWSSDGTRLASASGGCHGGELMVWEMQSGKCLQAFVGQPALVSSVTWDQSGNLLVSGGSDGVLRWWEVHSGACLRMRQGHQGTILSLKRSPDGRWLASGGNDGAIRIWEMQSGELVQTLRRDRPYERLDITGLRGVTEVQKVNLRALGALEEMAGNSP
jgi:WD40 repeat protein/transcriptional regulator with XRE-family HTH domain